MFGACAPQMRSPPDSGAPSLEVQAPDRVRGRATGVKLTPLGPDLFNGNFPPLVAGAIYFAVAAYDDWRVRGRRFAERPTVLFRFDPMNIEYLEPL